MKDFILDVKCSIAILASITPIIVLFIGAHWK